MSWDGSHYTGARLASVDTSAAQQVPGVVDILVQNNFIGIIASQLHAALHARSLLHVDWSAPTKESVAESSSVAGPSQIARDYVWPDTANAATDTQAIASYDGVDLTIWTRCLQPQLLRNEIASLCDIAAARIRIIDDGQTGVNGYDVAVDAALLTLHARQPVQVRETTGRELSKIQIRLSAALRSPSAEGHPIDSCTIVSKQYPTARPSIAALLCGQGGQYPASVATHVNYYPPDTEYVVAPRHAALTPAHQGAPVAAQVFAYESFFDELCHEQGLDPVQARLEQLDAGPGRSLIESVAKQAQWHPMDAPADRKTSGRGFAYTHIVDRLQDPPQQVWAAWVADIAIHEDTGAIDVTRLTVGSHSENLHEASSSAASIEQEVRRAALQLIDGTDFDVWGQSTDDSDGSNALALPHVELVPASGTVRHGLSWNEHAQLPAAAAIANAIYDATGVRFRQPPFDAQALKQALQSPQGRFRKRTYAILGAVAAALGGVLISALPWRSTMAPAAATIDTSIYSQAAINRGRLVATAGDCIVCHTAPGAEPNTGGRALETPFGLIYSTNITPDKETGIGGWTYAAFERAMREGIHQDGRHLYPAFPYTAFAKISDADMQSLYAYLMTQPAVAAPAPENSLRFPFSVRPLMAGWNFLFHKNEQFKPDTTESTLWNRGAYLVQGMGHCAACHSPRNAMGAEKTGEINFLGGGFVDGWEAPALNTLSKAPLPWTEDELFQYLRTGFSSMHGVAAGPMGPVVQGLAQLPEADVRAIAHYVSSLNPVPPSDTSRALQAAQLEDLSKNDQTAMLMPGESLFEGACAVCHDARGGPPLFGARPSLALNTNLHSDSPDNVIQVLLHGIEKPAMDNLGQMPGFAQSMNDDQLITLIEYLRLRFAPGKPAWTGVHEKLQALRERGPH